MAYHYSRKLNQPFDTVLSRLTENLRREGFGVITCIDVQETLKQRLDIEFRRYKILGAFHPEIAYKAISLDSHIGVLFPCHVVVQQHENGEVEVSAISSLETIDETMITPVIAELAASVDSCLRMAVDDLHREAAEPHHAEALPVEPAHETSPSMQG